MYSSYVLIGSQYGYYLRSLTTLFWMSTGNEGTGSSSSFQAIFIRTLHFRSGLSFIPPFFQTIFFSALCFESMLIFSSLFENKKAVLTEYS